MKILMTTGIFPPDIGGPASYVPQMAKSLTERGHDVQVLTLSDAVGHDDSVYPFGLIRIIRGQNKPFRAIKTVCQIVIIAAKVDVLYVNGLSFESMIGAILVNKFTVHKVVGDYAWERAVGRGWYEGAIDTYQQATKSFILKLLDIIRTLPLKHAKKVITPSNYLKNIIGGWGVDNNKTQVIYNAVNIENDQNVVPYTPPPYVGKTIITVCRLVPWKRVDSLICATAKQDNTRLIILGDGPLRTSLELLAAELNVKERILFMGNVPKAAVRLILSSADLFVLNSTYEGLPHVVLEAMVAGIPVIATDVGGTGEVVLDGITGRLIPHGDETALLAAIKELLENIELAKEMTKKATKMVKSKFVYNNMVDETETVIGLIGIC